MPPFDRMHCLNGFTGIGQPSLKAEVESLVTRDFKVAAVSVSENTIGLKEREKESEKQDTYL